jgi:uncharacterized protein
MIYLLDINVLLGLAYPEHVHHKRASQWLENLRNRECRSCSLATCAITELGFLRIASGGSKMALSLKHAKEELYRFKQLYRPVLLGDELPGDVLPEWVSKSKHTTDGHLVELARRHYAVFATLDTGIPGALLVSDAGAKPWRVRDAPPELHAL